MYLDKDSGTSVSSQTVHISIKFDWHVVLVWQDMCAHTETWSVHTCMTRHVCSHRDMISAYLYDKTCVLTQRHDQCVLVWQDMCAHTEAWSVRTCMTRHVCSHRGMISAYLYDKTCVLTQRHDQCVLVWQDMCAHTEAWSVHNLIFCSNLSFSF